MSGARMWGSALAGTLLILLAGCTSLTLTRINSAEKKPGNVWVFFTVEDGEEPVAGLEATDFEIYEDGKLVSQFESKQTIQNPEVAAVMYTLLLLDMSGSITQSGERDAVVDAANVFSEKVGETQKVGVYAFEGGEDIKSVVRFTEAKPSIDGGLDGLRTYEPKDPSTNLHGAVAQGIAELRTALDKDKRPLKFGTMVVFTDGTDRAHRVTKEDMMEELGKEEYADLEIFVIGVGAEIEESTLKEIGRDGTELATDSDKTTEAFEKVATRIDRHARRFYLLSYCSPSRNDAAHTVRIQANVDGKGGKDGNGNRGGKKQGSLEYEFESGGFGPPPDCDPNKAPTFPLDKNLVPPDEDDGKSGGKGKASASARIGSSQ